MFTNLQAPSQVSMARWLARIVAPAGDLEFPGFEAHRDIERIEIFTFAF